MNKYFIIVGYQYPLIIDRTSRQKISKYREVLNNTASQLYLIDILKALNPQTAEDTFFSKCSLNIYQDRPYSEPLNLNIFKRI